MVLFDRSNAVYISLSLYLCLVLFPKQYQFFCALTAYETSNDLIKYVHLNMALVSSSGDLN